MKIRLILPLVIFICSSCMLFGSNKTFNVEQDSLPYFYELQENVGTYSAGTVSARMIEGLGFRYYWASKDLRQEDLEYDPGNGGQTCAEVLEHILNLSRFVLRTVKEEVHDNTRVYPDLSWEEQRKETLNNLKEASLILRASNDVSAAKIIFKRGENTSEFPFWNLINGPISDAIYHTGQITSFRRSAGNPINPNISLLRGKVRD